MSNLHQAQSHDVLRSWQSQRNDVNHHKDFVLPMFIGNDDDLVEPIESMIDVNRYGCNRAIEYLEPLVYSYGLRAVLLFPVVTKSDHAKLRINDDDDDTDTISSSDSSVSHSSSSSDDDETTDIIAERLLGVDEIETPTNPQNPFLNQNEEEEDHLLGDQTTRRAGNTPVVGSTAERKTGVVKTSKALDLKLIKGLALKEQHNPVLRLIPRLRSKFPELLIICDVCLCAFTSTGHCCLFENQSPGRCDSKFPLQQTSNTIMNNLSISNKITCQYLALLAVEYGNRGCNVVAPSDMMDGRILTIREKLDESKLQDVAIMSYSAKFASSFYGPFRQATKNAPEFGDRRSYQLPPGSRTMALKAVERDIRQGADFVMVKPGSHYLDIVRDIRENHPAFPIAIYQVSGEYAMLKMAAKANILDLKLAVNEWLTSYRRAGATIIISYFTPQILQGEL